MTVAAFRIPSPRRQLWHEQIGRGRVGGDPPSSLDPDAPDGRFKRLNVPGRGRVDIFDRAGMLQLATVWSQSDGTWEFVGLNLTRHLMIIGRDETATVNAAVQDWILPVEIE